ncbi:hypothetical protein F8M41_004163 [Gigaspora margarita]|uniref:Uncharacterized protein n=1 Tax=Gigaspora margarita TaxID=4874 RepID=A0A8H4A5M4_GIGMA|nr:hypothetical protein F8M41_004163 [Gigaspora margarita]
MFLSNSFHYLSYIFFFASFFFTVQAQESNNNNISDGLDFLITNVIPLIIVFYYGPEQRSWYGPMVYYTDDFIILSYLCILPLIMMKTIAPEMDIIALNVLLYIVLFITFSFFLLACVRTIVIKVIKYSNMKVMTYMIEGIKEAKNNVEELDNQINKF